MTVLKMQQKNLTVLQRYIRLVYAGDMKRLGRLLLRLPSIRTIATNIEEVFEQFIIFDRAPLSDLIQTSLLDTDEEIQALEEAQQVIMEQTDVDQVVIAGLPDDMEVTESGTIAVTTDNFHEDETTDTVIDPANHTESAGSDNQVPDDCEIIHQDPDSTVTIEQTETVTMEEVDIV